jgi:hypothetical protein
VAIHESQEGQLSESKWLSLWEAQDLIQEEVGAFSVARDLLRDHLVQGKIQAKAGHLVISDDGRPPTRKQAEPITPDFWRTAEFRYSEHCVTRSIHKAKKGRSRRTDISAYKVLVSTDDLVSIWPGILDSLDWEPPADDGQVTAKPPEDKHIPTASTRRAVRTGRRPVHDWYGALALTVVYFHQNGFPADPKELREKITGWYLSQNHRAPDERDVRRFVDGIYEELERVSDKLK